MENEDKKYTQRDVDNMFANQTTVLNDMKRVRAVYQGDKLLNVTDVIWTREGVWIWVAE